MFSSPLENSQKFGRYFILRVETNLGDIVTIKYPFTCEFDVTRNNLASVNTARFVIYNLNEDTRLSLFKDPFDQTTFRLVSFSAGYKNDETYLVPEIFRGSIKECYSEREGPDVKTIIECYDGQQAMTTGFATQTLPAGVSLKDRLKQLMNLMPTLQGGVVTVGEEEISKRGTALMGNPADVAKQLTNSDFYIDKLNGYAIGPEDVFIGPILNIDSDSGILEIPKKMQSSLTISILFEPRIIISQIINIKSDFGKMYNGEYKVTGISHKGTISGAVGGDYRTTLTLLTLGGSVPVFKVVSDLDRFKIVQVGVADGQ